MTQREALSILKTGAHVFLTGSPGAGKTHVVNEFINWLRASGIEPSITATTGIAATHVAGMTLHAWSGIGIADSLTRGEIDRIASKEPVARRIGKAKVLIIDEISMLSASVFEAADAVCREVRRSEAPFGGIPVVLVGDFFQLPPVSRLRESQFCYDSATWRALSPLVCYLTEQYRQDDADFLEVLSAIRAGEVEALHYERLNTRRVADAPISGAPKLYSHNADVDRINAGELAKLPGAAETFRMTSSGRENLVEALKRGCLSPETLELKVGAEVMFTKNSPGQYGQSRFVNGTLGRVVGFEKGTGLPAVKTRERGTVTAEPMEWQVVEEGKVRATISQVPLRLAYAMTVHKSQGMSMDAAIVDLSRAFEYGQGYVALSRVRRLAGLSLLGLNARALEVHPEVAEKDRELRASSEACKEAFAQMPEEELIAMQKNFVKAQGGRWPSEAEVKQASTKRPAKASDRYADTLAALREHKTLAAVAKARSLTPETIIRHIEVLHKGGKVAREDYAHLLPKTDVIDEIREALRSVEDDRLAPIFYKLGGRHSYETIRLARLAFAQAE
jgi:hypothetical protein